jgi:hypothetical protein
MFVPWPDINARVPLNFEFTFYGYALYDAIGPGGEFIALGDNKYRFQNLQYDSLYQITWSCELQECNGEPDFLIFPFLTVSRPTGWQAVGEMGSQPRQRDETTDSISGERRSILVPERVFP